MTNNRFSKFVIRHKALFISLIMSIISILLLILTQPLQDTGDDAFIAWELSRGKGAVAAFISPYLSLILSSLYAYWPNIAWWTWTAFLGGWALLGIGFYIILKRYKGFIVYVTSIVWYIMTSLAIINKINFTRTATAYALAGGLVVLLAASNQNKKLIKQIVLYILGFSLFLIGAMIRFQAALLIIPFMGIILLCWHGIENLIQIKKCFSRVWIGSFIKKITSLLLLVMLTILLFGLNEFYWNTHPDWKEYNKYNSTRSEIADYVEYYPTWDEAEDEYKALGLKSENDLDVLFGFVFVGDTQVFSLETLEGITELKNQSLNIIRRIYRMFEKVVNMLTEGKIIFWCILFVILIRYYVGRKRYLPIVLCCCYALAVLFLFSYLGRMMLRVWEPTLLCCVGMLLLYFTSNEKRGEGYSLEISGTSLKNGSEPMFAIYIRDYVIIAFCIFLLALTTGEFESISKIKLPSYSDDRDQTMRDRAEYINSNPERIYLLSWPLIHHPPTPGFFGIWEALPEDYLKNCFALSNWDARVPYNMDALSKLGIDNPVEALISRTDTYSDFEYRVYRFLREHYNSNITMSKVDSFQDGGSIIQYTAPIEETKIIENSKQSKILLDDSTYRQQNEMDAWYIKGKIELADNYEALYCNMIFKDKVYTFRLSYNNKYIEAYLYGIGTSQIEAMEDCYLIGLNQNGNYIRLANLNLE